MILDGKLVALLGQLVDRQLGCLGPGDLGDGCDALGWGLWRHDPILPLGLELLRAVVVAVGLPHLLVQGRRALSLQLLEELLDAVRPHLDGLDELELLALRRLDPEDLVLAIS